MEFRLLGPVELWVAGRSVPLGGARQRSVVAALAVDAGRPVPADTLIDRVWGDTPPRRVRQALHVYIARFRGLLRRDVGDAAPARVTRRSGGYMLDVDSDCVDVHRFRRLVHQGRDRECPDEDRVQLLGQALDMWRGGPLADLPGDWAARVRQGWQEQYLEATLVWAQACLRLDDPGKTLARLTDLAGEHPMVESVAAALMRALYATGRPSDALEHYDRVRRLLAGELGCDPGPELQQLHRQILSADPELPRPVGSPPRQLVPRHLPPPPQVFTGRASELGELTRVRDSSAVVITAIAGMAGIGKTALAVHAAHQIADRFPDGQLFIDLHGYTIGVAPVGPGEALDRLLRTLGVAGEQIPADLEERVGLYRSRLADRRVLIVLDNAATEAQVAPLLPAAAGCLVLVTSRHRLAGLDHTDTVSLDTLPLPDAVALFRRTVGEDRLAGQSPEVMAATVELCGRLPLAIRIVAAWLGSHSAWSVAQLVEQLRDQDRQLVDLEDGSRSVAAALELSYQQLSADQQHMYRLLGLHPGPDIDPYAAAALARTTVACATRLLDQLLYAHLLQEPAPSRYVFHDLVRAHATGTAGRAEAEPVRRSAVCRLLDHYRHTAATAMDSAYPYERERRPQVPPAGTPTPDLPEPARATAWLDTELPNLLAAARHAADDGWPEHTWHLSATLNRHLTTRGRYHDAETLHHQTLTTARTADNRSGELDALTSLGEIHRRQGRSEAIDHFGQALEIAHTTGHRTGEVDALTGIGHIHRVQGRHELATGYFGQALEVARTTGDRAGEPAALSGLGNSYLLQGRHEQAARYFGQALEVARITGHRAGELDALIGIGDIHRRQGRYERATKHFGQALEIARTTGDRPCELRALAGLGLVHQLQGRHEQAAGHYTQVLQMARTTGHRRGEMSGLTSLGNTHRLQGHHERAADCYHQALHLARESGDRNAQFEALLGRGRLHESTGHPKAASVHHQEALELATEIGQPGDQARAHDGLAHAYHALHQPERARKHWLHALYLFASLGTDFRDDEEATIPAIRTHLANLDQQREPLASPVRRVDGTPDTRD